MIKKEQERTRKMNDNPKEQEKTNNCEDESIRKVACEICFPFLLAGFGMVLAGVLLDYVQYWPVFDNCPQLFILVPALLGLKVITTQSYSRTCLYLIDTQRT